jgi:hypothetical protein
LILLVEWAVNGVWAISGNLLSCDQEWDNPAMIVRLDAKRRFTIPAMLAPASPGDYFDARFDAEEDALVFRRLAGTENWLTVLKACAVSPEDAPPRRWLTGFAPKKGHSRRP